MLNSESNLASLIEQPVGPDADPLDENYMIGGLADHVEERLDKSNSKTMKSSKRSSPSKQKSVTRGRREGPQEDVVIPDGDDRHIPGDTDALAGKKTKGSSDDKKNTSSSDKEKKKVKKKKRKGKKGDDTTENGDQDDDESQV